MTPDLAYAELVRRSRDRTVLASCLGLLVWDQKSACRAAAWVIDRSRVRCSRD